MNEQSEAPAPVTTSPTPPESVTTSYMRQATRRMIERFKGQTGTSAAAHLHRATEALGLLAGSTSVADRLNYLCYLDTRREAEDHDSHAVVASFRQKAATNYARMVLWLDAIAELYGVDMGRAILDQAHGPRTKALGADPDFAALTKATRDGGYTNAGKTIDILCFLPSVTTGLSAVGNALANAEIRFATCKRRQKEAGRPEEVCENCRAMIRGAVSEAVGIAVVVIISCAESFGVDLPGALRRECDSLC